MSEIDIKQLEDKIFDLKNKLKEMKPRNGIIDNKKKCSKCFIIKDVSDFRKKDKTTIRADCSSCQDIRNAKYYKKNKEDKKILCDCGLSVIGSYFNDHIKTKKCQKTIIRNRGKDKTEEEKDKTEEK
jgi:hypothetical protein